MELKRRLLCWSYGKIYELVSFEAAALRPTVTLTAAGVSLPAPGRLVAFMPDDKQQAELASITPNVISGIKRATTPQESAVTIFGEQATHWILELPLLDYEELIVAITANDEQFTYTLTPEAAIAASDEHFTAHADLCKAISTVDGQLLDQALSIQFLRYFDGDHGPIWRMEITGQTAKDTAALAPAVTVTDTNGVPVTHELVFFERQTVTAAETTTYLTYSLLLDAPCSSFLVIASDPAGRLLPGFCSMNSHDLARAQWDTWITMRSVTNDPEGYRHWFAQQLPTPEELDQERAAFATDDPDAFRPLLSLVFVLDHPDERELTGTILSIIDQTYPNWELVLVHTPAAGDQIGPLRAAARKYASPWTYWGQFIATFGDERLRLEALGGYAGKVGAVNAGIQATRGQWIVLIDQDIVLEPNAFAQLVAAIDHYPEATVFYGDEDTVDENGFLSDPLFKAELNLDHLYTTNDVAGLLAIQKTQLFKIGLPGEEAAHALNYEIMLRAIAAGALTGHVPAILTHTPSFTTSLNRSAFRWSRHEAECRALSRHFAARGVEGTLELLFDPPGFRMHYALPKPAPLVSIVIPNKDHLDVLEPCLRSLIEEATYPAFEIVIVENNSTEPATFAYYDQITAVDPRVKVVTWDGPFNYSAIINFGGAASRGEYLLLLNNDTKLITPDGIEEMVGYFNRPEVGVVGAKLYFRDHLVQHAGMLLGVHGAVAHVNQNFVKPRNGYLNNAIRPGNFSAVTGACQLVSRAVFNEVGGYEEELATGFNDVDFCLKVRRTGRLIVFTPYAEWYHYEFTSRPREAEDPAEMARWEAEKAWMHARWPEMTESGDPYLSPHLDPNNAYYNLPGAVPQADEW